MTVTTQTASISYIGNGSTTVFTFPFVYVSSTDITVTYTNSSGTETVLNPSQYTFTGNTPSVGQLWGIGGSVTYPISGSPISTGTFLTITRTLPFEQIVTITNQGAFYPQVVEQALDLLCLLIQQTQTQVSYAIQCPEVDTSAPIILPPAAERANNILGFDMNGNPALYVNNGMSIV